MCGVVKPPRLECGPMYCRLPGQAVSEAHQHAAVCQVGARVGAGHRPPARGLRHTFSPGDQGDHLQDDRRLTGCAASIGSYQDRDHGALPWHQR
jgi:hypothetical protein